MRTSLEMQGDLGNNIYILSSFWLSWDAFSKVSAKNFFTSFWIFASSKLSSTYSDFFSLQRLFIASKQDFFVTLRQKQNNSIILKILMPVKSPRVPPTTASCWLKVILSTLFETKILFVGVSTVTIEMYFCTYCLQ